MKKSSSLILLVSGVVLTILGISATHSLSSDLSKFFHGAASSNDHAVWMLLAGSIVSLVGLVLTWRHRKQA
jgi:hypothetical protein